MWYRVQATWAGVGSAAGNVPVGFRPTGDAYVPITNISTGQGIAARIFPSDGNIQLTSNGAIGQVIIGGGHWESAPS